MSGLNGLTLAVPRGALMRETLDLLDALGADTAEVRATTASCCSPTPAS